MTQCKNRLGERCRLDGELCKHLVYDGCCSNAEVDYIGRVTFREALDTILTANCCKERKSTYRRSFGIVIENTGFRWDDDVEYFEYEVAEKLVEKLEKKYKPQTIQSVLGAIYYSGNIAFRTKYKELKKKRPVFEKFPYRIKTPREKPVLTWEQRNAIRFEMENRRREALDKSTCGRRRLQSRNMFIALWWGWYFGTRNGDVNNMKWSNITTKNGIPHVEWVPHKTISKNTRVCWPISEDAYNSILPFVGRPDELCIVSEEKFIPKGKGVSYVRRNIHTYMWKKLNAFFRSIGLNGWEAFYSLRYMNAQQVYREHGAAAESAKMGHGSDVGARAYYDKGDHSYSI